ncbi:hypothetical protein LCGC14_3120770 [marine sediment metagenome]|uniref:Uncharacterized protein n=2 Tax=root TaxID=1 RepID=A0A831VPC9_9FLAO|nr:hypothetical protein [Pricia antarctica]
MNSTAVIVAIGSIAALALVLFKKYFSTDANTRELKKSLREVRGKMKDKLEEIKHAKSAEDEDMFMDTYNELDTKRLQILAEISLHK